MWVILEMVVLHHKDNSLFKIFGFTCVQNVMPKCIDLFFTLVTNKFIMFKKIPSLKYRALVQRDNLLLRKEVLVCNFVSINYHPSVDNRNTSWMSPKVILPYF